MIENKIRDLIEESLNHMGYDLVRVQYSGNKTKDLEIMIDRLDGETVDMNDCVAVTKHLSAMMDVEDPIAEKYIMEVTSPGLDRPLTRHKDYVRFNGSHIKLKTIMPIDGKKNFKGVLAEVREDGIALDLDDAPDLTLEVNFDNIAAAKIIPEYDQIMKNVKK